MSSLRFDTSSAFWQAFGPGLLWAAAAIGVSHLVQSTRAGADGGFSLVWVVLLALAVKYPFFEYGPRYAAATGESLVEGYLRLGRWAVWAYLLITLSTALIIQSAVTLFTAFLFARALGVDWSMPVMGAVVLSGCALLLRIGRFRALDGTIKIVLLALAVCTLAAAALTLPRAGDAGLHAVAAGGGPGAIRLRLHPRAGRMDALGLRHLDLELALDAREGSLLRRARHGRRGAARLPDRVPGHEPDRALLPDAGGHGDARCGRALQRPRAPRSRSSSWTCTRRRSGPWSRP
jgi:hypothetical protein